MSEIAEPFSFPGWIAENQHLLKPPVGNKEMFPGSDDFIVMVVGGPNQRTDFHVDPYEEFFYQVKGNMHVRTMTPDGPKDVHIREGEMWVLPGNVPHSPQRPEPGSIGLVVERVRSEGTLEKFQWYCPNCDALLHEEFIALTDIETQMPPLFERFYANPERRRCRRCGTVLHAT